MLLQLLLPILSSSSLIDRTYKKSAQVFFYRLLCRLLLIGVSSKELHKETEDQVQNTWGFKFSFTRFGPDYGL